MEVIIHYHQFESSMYYKINNQSIPKKRRKTMPYMGATVVCGKKTNNGTHCKKKIEWDSLFWIRFS